MARARNIKPGFFKNENLAECSPWARLCFAGLWTLADREGRLEDRPKRIKGELFSFDTIDVDPLLAELEQWGFIRRYTVNGNKFIEICSFSKHQNPHHKEVASVIPAPESPGLSPHAKDEKPEALPSCMDDESETSPRFSTHECVKQGVKTVLIPDSLLLIPDSDLSDLVGKAPTEGVVVPIRPDIPACPHQEILALYHEILPTLTQMRRWDGTRAKNLTTRWREDAKRRSLDYWRGFFEYVSQSDFLMGRSTRWRADLEWLTKAANFTKVIEGKYENSEAAQ
jgi:hypothetical protein